MPDLATINGVAEDDIATYNGTTASEVTSIGGATWVHTPPPYNAHFLIVGGGGSGNNLGYGHMNSGGGAGGLRTSWAGGSGGGGSSESQVSLAYGVVYTITVGAGNNVRSVIAPSSSIVGTGVSLISLGGGAASYNGPITVGPTIGGCGGGGFGNSGTPGAAGTANQGYAGGDSGGAVPTRYPGGGGGGTGAVGISCGPNYTPNGHGGAGFQVNIDTNNYYWGGGGGTASHSPGYPANGGIGVEGEVLLPIVRATLQMVVLAVEDMGCNTPLLHQDRQEVLQ